jgi:ribosomal protein L44E
MLDQQVAGLVAVTGDDVERALRETASAASSATRRMDRQASSAGLTTQVLPAARAPPTQRPKICIG